MDGQSDQITTSLLCGKGDPRDSFRWDEGTPDYVSELGLQPGHIPTLISIARKWADNGERSEDEWSAPIHAWRSLGQLRAEEAVEPLLDMQNQLDELGDDWYLEEFHGVFGLIGRPAIAALSKYLTNHNNREFPRISTASGLCQIAKWHPETRDQVVEVLATQLAEHEVGVYSLNGFLVGHLADLQAVESSEAIERAFAAGVVDETVAGHWTTIRKELGVPGLGLVPNRPPPRRPHFGTARSLGDPVHVDRLDRDRQRQSDKKAKAKRKQQKQARKRNRKKR